MYLKSLTLKGFKSFASGTTLRLEPGVTCVVGPNGSGKSNVVDAIAWVLGEQGAKSLRGGKMEDVIFAGTRSRPPLGRAEVVLTFDNSDGALAVEYAEVTISRLMYRSGESEYAINGHRCRLLDVQELLSDAGIGREMHVIVGQGQLDAVLHASPEDRRAYIEEASGILKHRRRKEKALRKLAATDASSARLDDLLTEIRRQLKPLGRQAEAARRAAGVQADARDARARLLADDLSKAGETLRLSLEAGEADVDRRDQLREEVEAATAARELIESGAAAATGAEGRHRDLAHRLETLAERFEGLVRVAGERQANLEAPLPTRSGPDPARLAASVDEATAEGNAADAEVRASQERVAEVVSTRRDTEEQATTAERAYLLAVRAAADRREGLARLSEQVGAARSRSEAAAAESERVGAARDDVAQGLSEAREVVAGLRARAGGLDAEESELDARHEEAEARHHEAAEQLMVLRSELTAIKERAAVAAARADALALGMVRKDGAGALVGGLSDGMAPPRVLGAVGQLVTVAQGYEAAMAAALGPIADAVAVPGVDGVSNALAWLHAADRGRAGMLVVHEGPRLRDLPVPVGAHVVLEAGTRRLADLVVGDDGVAAATRLVVSDVVVVEDVPAAVDLVRRQPSLRAVTITGDLVGSLVANGGPAGAPSIIEVQAAYEAACSERDEITARMAFLGADEQAALAIQAAAEADTAEALEQLNACDARVAAAQEELASAVAAVRSFEADARRLEAAANAAAQAYEQGHSRLAELTTRLSDATAQPSSQAEPDAAAKDLAATAAVAAREQETQARLALRAAEERQRTATDRLRRLERALAAEQEARRREAEATQRRARGAAAAREVHEAAMAATGLARHRLTEVVAWREESASEATRLRAALVDAKRALAESTAELERLSDALHRIEVARTEHQLRVDELRRRATEEVRLDPEALLEEFGPHRPVLYADGTQGPFDRPEQERRLAKADKELARIGSVNPLALEEFAALEERHDYLVRQLDDVRATRRDLMTVVAEVDARIRTVFAQAFEDVATQFTDVFAVLFPGGEGRLVLTDPDDPLTTGVEVEARPPGKRVKRLSLLSGGERSLTAIALLVAIFRARPSPFYVLDEVEAALDDTNLGRLVGLLDSLRAFSQLLIITHQKRTMEVADALYGVSMQGDGMSKVISQRLRDAGTVPGQRAPLPDSQVPAG